MFEDSNVNNQILNIRDTLFEVNRASECLPLREGGLLYGFLSFLL